MKTFRDARMMKNGLAYIQCPRCNKNIHPSSLPQRTRQQFNPDTGEHEVLVWTEQTRGRNWHGIGTP